MSRKLSLVAFFCLCFSLSIFGQNIPDRMEYCGQTLRFTPGAKSKLKEYVSKIYESPRYYNQLVQRASMYMPFIEEAFENIRVPEDLKFLAIQESALRPDVISTSNAVGFWQFKEDTGHEMGLRINDKVDERMHIYRSSEAAGIYFSEANSDFDNWVYAVIAYYEGMTGAVAYTDPQYYGTDVMLVTEDLHWYALKAIAHKIAYEEAISLRKRPEKALVPYSNEGNSNIRTIISSHQINEDLFFEYNKWILNPKRFPRESLFTYYIPINGEFYTGHKQDPNKVIAGGAPTLAMNYNEEPQKEEPVTVGSLDALNSYYAEETTNSPTITETSPQGIEEIPAEVTSQTREVPEPTPSPVPSSTSVSTYSLITSTPIAGDPSTLPTSVYVDFDMKQDLHYNVQYMLYDGSRLMAEVADIYSKRLSDILVWNGLIPGQEPPIGKVIYLDKPIKLEYHIVEPNESLAEISSRYQMSIETLQQKNRLEKGDLNIYVGQKLYIKKRKSKDEKMIILKNDTYSQSRPELVEKTEIPINDGPTEIAIKDLNPQQEIADVSQEKTSPNVQEPPTNESRPNNETTSRWVTHTVQVGETLWQISQQYQTKVEIIKMINKLTTDDISEGQSLRILTKE